MSDVTGDVLAARPRAVPAEISRVAALAWVPALALWSAIVAVAIPLHEPWFDEAQAWLIARDETLGGLLGRMSYEGTPPLWHLLLFPLAKLGAPYASMQAVAGVSAFVAAYLVMRYAPYPPPVRLLLPFGYFGLYQYAVVARSYCVLMALTFAAAVLYAQRIERPGRLVAVLIALSLTALHGWLLAAGILAAHALDLRGQWRLLRRDVRRRQLRAFAAFAVCTLFIVALLWPRPDFGGLFPGHDYGPANLVNILGWMVDGAFASQPVASAAIVAFSLWWFRRTGTLALFLLPLLLAFQVPAAARTIRADAAEPYSGSKAAATWLSAHRIGSGVFARGFAASAVLPWLVENPFVNADRGPAHGCYGWSRGARALQDDRSLRRLRPRYVLVSTKFQKQPMRLRGYRVVARFPGHLLWKGRAIEDDSYVLLERR